MHDGTASSRPPRAPSWSEAPDPGSWMRGLANASPPPAAMPTFLWRLGLSFKTMTSMKKPPRLSERHAVDIACRKFFLRLENGENSAPNLLLSVNGMEVRVSRA